MARKNKSKARLDKYYDLAKQQGFRSRAAFKLVQLNRKYNFLSTANSLVDLCAAPGGWLQVSAKFMPVSSLKIGIDLDPIKPIPGCKTFQEDITTQKCISLIKRETSGKKVDVVLHDGAPNVGAEWSKDAYMQNELTLAALKLACMILRKGGVFVTKVFRSTDYNSLIWVFNKFFAKVESTKPQASRMQSAEIFVVCLDFIAPEYTDPKLFDAKYVFKNTEADLLNPHSAKQYESLDALLAKKRNRQGYSDDVGGVIYKEISFEDFLNAENVISVFGEYNKILWTEKDKEKYLPIAKPPEDYLDIMEDLRLQGKRELGSLMKWRSKIQRAFAKKAKENGEKSRKESKDMNIEEENDTDSEIEEKLRKAQLKEIREKRKEREVLLHRIAKQSDPSRGSQVFHEDAEDFEEITHGFDLNKLGYFDLEEEEENKKAAEQANKGTRFVPNSTKEMEDNLEYLWEEKQLKKKVIDEKQRKKKLLKKKMGQDLEEEENEEDNQLENLDDEDDGGKTSKTPKARGSKVQDTNIPETVLNSRWFDKDIFKQAITHQSATSLPMFVNPLKANKKDEMEEEKAPSKNNRMIEEDSFDDDSDDSELETIRNAAANKKKTDKKKKAGGPAHQGDIQIVPRYNFDDFDEDSLATTRALAKKMLRQKDREEIIDSSYNRYSKPEDEEDLPEWFVEDERRHNHKILPITKEEYQAELSRIRALDAKPPKKVQEAKIRNRIRMQKKMNKARVKANQIINQEGISEGIKMRQVEKIYKKEQAGLKQEKTYRVTRKFNDMDKKRRKIGRNTRLVDNRLKKDKRGLEKKGRLDGRSKKIKKTKRHTKRH